MLLALSAPLVAGCGFDAATDAVYQPAVGANSREGNVDILGAVIVAAEDDQGTFIASLVNNDVERPAQMTAIAGDDAETEVASPVTIPADGIVNLADTGAISVSGAGVAPGRWVEVSLDFRDGQSTELLVPVVLREEEFADVTMVEGQRPLELEDAEPVESGR